MIKKKKFFNSLDPQHGTTFWTKKPLGQNAHAWAPLAQRKKIYFLKKIGFFCIYVCTLYNVQCTVYMGAEDWKQIAANLNIVTGYWVGKIYM